jgi:hypothetical protein
MKTRISEMRIARRTIEADKILAWLKITTES